MGKILIIKGTDFSSVAVDKVEPIVGKIPITVIASPIAGGGVSGTGFYDEGENVTITATANTGYTFVQWNDGNTDKTRVIIVGGTPKTYTAIFEQEVSLTEKVSWAVLFDRTESKLIAVKATTFDGYVIPVTTGEKYKITTSLQRDQPPVVSINSSSMNSSVVMSEILPHGSITPSLWNRQEFIIPDGVTHIFIQQVNNSYKPAEGEPNYPVTGYELKLWKVG